MKNIKIIYSNDTAISFYWKNVAHDNLMAQVIFRDTGFYFTLDQLKTFSFYTQRAQNQHTCQNCPTPDSCRSVLLKTPVAAIDLAVNKVELDGLQDLLDQTILKMETHSYMQTALN